MLAARDRGGRGPSPTAAIDKKVADRGRASMGGKEGPGPGITGQGGARAAGNTPAGLAEVSYDAVRRCAQWGRSSSACLFLGYAGVPGYLERRVRSEGV